MASLYAATPAGASINIASTTLTAFPKSCPLLTKVSQKRHQQHFRVFASQSNHKDDHNYGEQQIKAPRRNVMMGLGSLYGAAANFINDPFALAAPIPGPNVYTCGPATYKPGGEVIPESCCPPVPKEIINFKLPTPPSRLNVRPAAHLADRDYIKRYEEAIRRMRALPDDDPRSFKQQAKLHCAYCNGAYYQDGVIPKVKLSVHASWIFLPFHRFYLYFFEKICQELLNDPTFAIPFWNWDTSLGMTLPPMFAVDSKSPLYDKLRDNAHQPPNLVDLSFNGDDQNRPYEEQVRLNLSTVHKSVVESSKPEVFFGGKYTAGDTETGAGSLERVHNLVHRWTGDRNQPYGEDLGNFYSAGRDPVFYAHHGNVDRLWSVWRSLRGLPPRPWPYPVPDERYQDIPDPEYLNASFLFYNEKKQMVRVNVCDSLNTSKLGYEYQNVDNPWLDPKYRPKSRLSKATRKQLREAPKLTRSAKDKTIFPVKLDKVVKVMVKRPDKSERSKNQETLIIEKIGLGGAKFVKFDVFVYDEDEPKSTPENSEFAGFFASLPHGHDHDDGGNMTDFTQLLLPLIQILEEMEVEDDDDVIVTLVPRAGCDDVTVGGIKIVTDLNSLR